MLIFEQGKTGRINGAQAAKMPLAEEQTTTNDLPAELLREELSGLPEVSELQAVRHYTRLSQLNFSIDTQFYPLGSC
ncbi:MAG TPA: aminomethyl-transferring glycine dehydrogenase subunit GcvPB, partial [Gammaproteobacteria bacterium]|nr:aminomethyl-transferring glycine dehydrogenase subunit GcvPB [Gammaproteobacteria bacterium]